MAKPRYDKSGSIFGEIHRLLPDRCFLTDIDTMILKCDNELWSEYRYYNGKIKIVAIIEMKHKKTKYSLNHLDPEYSLTKVKIEIAKKIKARFLIGFCNNGKYPIEFFEIKTKTMEIINLGFIPLAKNREEERRFIKDFYSKIGLIDFKENDTTPTEYNTNKQLEFKEVA